jgi:hypothetical protein
MGTIVAFRIGQPDVEALSKYFQPTFDGNDLLRIPNYNTIIRTLIGGVPTQPFSMATLPPLGEPNEKLSGALKQLSAAKYGRPKSVVESEIFERLATKAAPPPPAGRPGGFGSPYPPAGAGMAPSPYGPPAGPSPYGPPAAAAPKPVAPPSAPGTFLDEWMGKRGGPLAMRPSPWANKQPAGAKAPAAPQPLPPQNVPQPPAMPAPAPIAPAAPTMPSAGDIPLDAPKAQQQAPVAGARLTHDTMTPEDTIFIDSEGMLHNRSEPPASQ